MIVREIKQNPDEVLKHFDYFNDYKDTRLYCSKCCPELIERLDKGNEEFMIDWNKQLKKEMNTYQCWFNGKSIQIKAETLYDAKKKAVDHFKAGKRHHLVSVALIAKGDTPVAIDPSSL